MTSEFLIVVENLEEIDSNDKIMVIAIAVEGSAMLVHNLKSSLDKILYQHPNIESKDRPKKEAGHSRLAGGSFNKQGSLHTRLVLGNHRRGMSPHLPTRIFKFYIEALTGFSHAYHPHYPTIHSSLKAVCTGIVGGTYIPKTGEWGEGLPTSSQ